MAAFGNDHGRGGFAVAPVSAHEGVGKVPRPHAFIGIEGDDFPDFPAVDDFFQGPVKLGVAQHVAHGHAALQQASRIPQLQRFFQRLGDGLFQQDMIAQLHGLPARSVMVVVLRADDGHVRQARFRQQGSGILEQADGIPFLLRGKVTNGFRALFDGIRRGGNAVAVFLFHGQLHVGARTGTAPDAGEGESLLFRHKNCADNMDREVKERRI